MIEVELHSAAARCGLSSRAMLADTTRLYYDPAEPPQCDYLVCESTYGNRDHPAENVFDSLAQIVNEAMRTAV